MVGGAPLRWLCLAVLVAATGCSQITDFNRFSGPDAGPDATAPADASSEGSPMQDAAPEDAPGGD